MIALEGADRDVQPNRILPGAVTRMTDGLDVTQYRPMAAGTRHLRFWPARAQELPGFGRALCLDGGPHRTRLHHRYAQRLPLGMDH